MYPRKVVLFQTDTAVAQTLGSVLSTSFQSVHEAHSLMEVRNSMAKHRAGIAILDLEATSFPDVQKLSQEFPHACIVCTHRLADEDIWTAALNAGAADVCPPSDTKCILRAAEANRTLDRSAAA